MFKTFTFKQLAILSTALCFLMLTGATLNAVSPYVTAFSGRSVELPIIMYHQISENPSIYGDYVIPLSLLENDFQYMKKHNITPVSFEAVLDFVEEGTPLPENPVIITFDDGERSFITKVLPLLEEYDYFANMNIVGALVELYTKNGDTNDKYAYLNDNDIRTLYEHPLVELGCHSYNLHSLSGRRGMGKLYGETNEDYEKLIRNDIDRFNNKLTALTGTTLKIFAYPYGIRNDILLSILKENGFRITLTCRESTNKITVGSDLYELGRFNRPYGKSSEMFFKEINT